MADNTRHSINSWANLILNLRNYHFYFCCLMLFHVLQVLLVFIMTVAFFIILVGDAFLILKNVFKR